MARPRLAQDVFAGSHRLVVVVAPAGSGKTTLLTQWATAADRPAAWYRASEEDRDAVSLLAYLHTAFTRVLGPLGEPWPDVATAATALDAVTARPSLLVVDDFGHLEGTPAEQVIGELVDVIPPWLTIVLASRRPPSFDISRPRVAGQVLDIGPDDLRFRCWEVDRLFKDCYGEHLPPEQAALLTRRTEGWAAGLQLFHLATRGASPTVKCRILDGLGSRTAVAAEYLTHNVLAGLPDDLSEFLVSTSVLGHLTGGLCDSLLARRGSAGRLHELERRQVFTIPVDEAGTYRYHEVLRSYLEHLLVERVGEAGARCRYRRAGSLLEEAGLTCDAIRAFGRAGAWQEVRRLAGNTRSGALSRDTAWVEAVPTDIADHDPWMLLARARRALGGGELGRANDLYRRAESEFGRSASAAGDCRRERLALAGWIDPTAPAPPGWHGRLLRGVRRDPGGEAVATDDACSGDERLASGVASLLAGDCRVAADGLREIAFASDSADPLRLAAQLLVVLADAVGGVRPRASELEELVDEADQLDLAWLVGLGRALLALTDRADGVNEAAAVRLASGNRGDAWGAAIAGLLQGLGAVARGRGDPVRVLRAASDELSRLGALTLDAWCRWALVAALPAGSDEAAKARLVAAQVSVAARVPGAERAVGWLIEGVRAGLGGEGDDRVAGAPMVAVRCFGAFSVEIDARPVDLTGIKPRHLERAANTGQPR